jgi:hypothetical protein
MAMPIKMPGIKLGKRALLAIAAVAVIVLLVIALALTRKR